MFVEQHAYKNRRIETTNQQKVYSNLFVKSRTPAATLYAHFISSLSVKVPHSHPK
jgi:hypothetical protein